MQKAVSYTPTNSEYKLELANLYSELGNNNEAIDIYKGLIKENPQNLELYYYLGDLYVKQHDVDKIIEVLNEIENNVGINENISLQKIKLYKSIGKKKQVLKELKRLVKKSQQKLSIKFL